VFGINASEFVVLLAVAAVVLGPERLPQYTQQLVRLIRELRRMAAGAQEKVREELGPEFDDVDWRALDPRRYDPRRIVREALSDSIDFDDPLGLKDWSRDKPVSAGGPVGADSWDAGGNGTGGADALNGAGTMNKGAQTKASLTKGTAGAGVVGSGPTPDVAESAFDPDAT
jgi:sec-independent protein translocase protein TatB